MYHHHHNDCIILPATNDSHIILHIDQCDRATRFINIGMAPKSELQTNSLPVGSCLVENSLQIRNLLFL